jgi:hypothetical protein
MGSEYWAGKLPEGEEVFPIGLTKKPVPSPIPDSNTPWYEWSLKVGDIVIGTMTSRSDNAESAFGDLLEEALYAYRILDRDK